MEGKGRDGEGSGVYVPDNDSFTRGVEQAQVRGRSLHDPRPAPAMQSGPGLPGLQARQGLLGDASADQRCSLLCCECRGVWRSVEPGQDGGEVGVRRRAGAGNSMQLRDGEQASVRRL